MSSADGFRKRVGLQLFVRVSRQGRLIGCGGR